MANSHESKLASLELQLEEALQMLRLVAANKRTCLEVEEWLKINFPEDSPDNTSLLNLLKGQKTP